MTCSICGGVRKQNERFSRTLFDTQHFFHKNQPIRRTAGAIVCCAHKSLEEERIAFRKTVRDAIRCAIVRFSRGDINVQQRDASIQWALKGWRTFLKDWNFKMKRFKAMSESDVLPERRYGGARAFLQSFVKQARTMVSLL